MIGNETKRRRGSTRLLYAALAALLAVAVLVLCLGGLQAPPFLADPAFLWRRLFKPLLRLAIFISIGLFVGQIIEASGWTGKIASLVQPLMRWGHLSDAAGASFTTAFVSGTAAQAMLMNFHQEGRLNRKELVLASLLNGLPAYFLHLPTTFFIVLPLAQEAGLLYLVLTFLATLLRTLAVLVCSRLSLPARPLEISAAGQNTNSWKAVLTDTWQKFRRRLRRVMVLVVPIYVVVMIVNYLGFFSWLRAQLASGITSTILPVESMSVVIFSLMAEFTSGFAAAGALLEAGTLTIRQTVIALLLGNVVATPVRALRHQLPYYMGIFTPGLGTLLIGLGQFLRVISVLVVGAVYVVLTGF